jgi:hypothetical protein
VNEYIARFTSRKFLLALATAIFALIQLQAGAITPQEALAAITAVFSVFIGIEGAADAAARQGENSTVIAAAPRSAKARAITGN